MYLKQFLFIDYVYNKALKFNLKPKRIKKNCGIFFDVFYSDLKNE